MVKWNVDPIANFALGPDSTAHQLYQLLGYGQTQARSAVQSSGRWLHLVKGLEQLVHAALRNAYACILNCEMNFIGSIKSAGLRPKL